MVTRASEKKILVADDDPDHTEIVGQILMREGFQVTTASDGQECLDLVAAEIPDLLLLDIDMPRVSGTEVCKRLRSSERTRGLKILMFSGNTQTREVAESFEFGADYYIFKPINPVQFIQTVRSCLSISYEKPAPDSACDGSAGRDAGSRERGAPDSPREADPAAVDPDERSAGSGPGRERTGGADPESGSATLSRVLRDLIDRLDGERALLQHVLATGQGGAGRLEPSLRRRLAHLEVLLGDLRADLDGLGD